ncbi:MAG: AEC family transporter [Rhodospirillaceae bacterium]|nr:AEC family transporter [Rhodospirillaceae bacterium]
MSETFTAIAPVVAVILLGWALRRAEFAPEAFWTGLDRLTYFILLPCLLVNGLAGANLGELPVGDAVLAAGAGVLAAVVLMHAVRRVVAPKPGAYGALVQCSLRGNNYPVLAIVVTLFDDVGLSAFALSLIAFVPLTNLISVIALVRTGSGKGAAAGALGPIVREILLNPILIAVALGLAINVADTGIPGPADSILEVLGRAALPLGLLAVGAGLAFDATAGSGRAVLASMAVKLLLLPALVLIGLDMLEIGGTYATALLIHAAVPCSVSAYAFARQLRGDAKTTAAMIAAQTVVSIVTLPFWLWLATEFL